MEFTASHIPVYLSFTEYLHFNILSCRLLQLFCYLRGKKPDPEKSPETFVKKNQNTRTGTEIKLLSSLTNTLRTLPAFVST